MTSRIIASVIAAAMLVVAGGSGAVAASADEVTPAPLEYTGVNLAGGDFGSNVPGEYGKDYTYPTAADADYYAGKGMNLIRLPFKWERVQRSFEAPLHEADMERIDEFVSYATGRGMQVILDAHNYARYRDVGVIGDEVPVSAFADLWRRLAERYGDNELVSFGLMNEPHDLPTELWRTDAQAAIDAIRATGATNLILVSGSAWDNAMNWSSTWYSPNNAEEMVKITDPAENYVFEAHLYLDDGTGTDAQCESTTIGSERMQNFTDWLRANDYRGFLGEFAGGASPTCLAALDDLLSHLDANRDVYFGWTYWAGGPWWPADEEFNVQPVDGQDKPQLAPLLKHIGSAPVVAPPTDSTPDPEVPGTPEPEVPVPGTPEPEVPGTPKPEVPATPEPEVPVPGTPEPEVPGTPEPEVPGTPDPEVPVPATPDPEVPDTEVPVPPAPEPEIPDRDLTDPTSSEPGTATSIYDDALAEGWTVSARRATVDPASTSPVAEGESAVLVTTRRGPSSVRFDAAEPVSTSGARALEITVHGGRNDTWLRLSTTSSPSGNGGGRVVIAAPAGEWTTFRIPLDELGSPDSVDELVLRGWSWQRSSYSVDDVSLVG